MVSGKGDQAIPPSDKERRYMLKIAKDSSSTDKVKKVSSDKLQEIFKKLTKLKPKSERKWFKGPKHQGKRTFYKKVGSKIKTAARTAKDWARILCREVALEIAEEAGEEGTAGDVKKAKHDKIYMSMGFLWDDDGAWTFEIGRVEQENLVKIKYNRSGGDLPDDYTCSGNSRSSMTKAVRGRPQFPLCRTGRLLLGRPTAALTHTHVTSPSPILHSQMSTMK